MWVVYERPSDYPEAYVARRWDIVDGCDMATQEVLVAATLEALREMLPEQLHRIARFAEDEPQIVEVWL